MIPYYAGIGSRETPEEILKVMYLLGQLYARAGHGLRSGGAPQADSAFEEGCDSVGGVKQIFLPSDGFNGKHSQYVGVTDAALELASKFHPAWERCRSFARILHARNGYQVLGPDLASPSRCVMCWTRDGGPTGGTGQAIRIAMANNIPVHNLYHPHILERALTGLRMAGLMT